MACEKGCKIHRKTTVLELLFDKNAGLRPGYLLKGKSGTGGFLPILWNH